jgi:hypothetical protein
MTHFFMVALYGTAYALAPFPSPARVRHSYIQCRDDMW